MAQIKPLQLSLGVLDKFLTVTPVLLLSLGVYVDKNRSKLFHYSWRKKALSESILAASLLLCSLCALVRGVEAVPSFVFVVFLRTVLMSCLFAWNYKFFESKKTISIYKTFLFSHKKEHYLKQVYYTFAFHFIIDILAIGLLPNGLTKSLIQPTWLSVAKRLDQLLLGAVFGLFIITGFSILSEVPVFKQRIQRVKDRYLPIWNTFTRRITEKVNQTKLRMNAKYNKAKDRLAYEKEYPEGLINIYLDRYVYFVPEKTKCELCLTFKTKKRVPKITSCSHRACIKCLQQYIIASCDDAEGTSLECPFSSSSSFQTSCKQIAKETVDYVLDPRDPNIDAQAIKGRLQDAYFRSGLMKLQTIMSCPSPDCKNAVFSDDVLIDKTYRDAGSTGAKLNSFDAAKGETLQSFVISEAINRALLKVYKVDEKGVDLRKFKCHSCKNASCVVCKNFWTYGVFSHAQLTCAEFHALKAEDNKNEEYMLTNGEIEKNFKEQKMKRCPKCEMIIEKNGGCPHMNCIQCKYQFCWTCLGPYGNCYCGRL